jgi:hypothetical protein
MNHNQFQHLRSFVLHDPSRWSDEDEARKVLSAFSQIIQLPFEDVWEKAAEILQSHFGKRR